MTDQNIPSSEKPNPTPDSKTTTAPSATEGETKNQSSANGSTTWETKPRAGEVKADDTKRFLSEIVALHGLSKAGDQIAKTIEDAAPGGILIVDDLSFAINDIFFLDIRNKLNMLKKWTTDISTQCHDYSEAEKEPQPKGELVGGFTGSDLLKSMTIGVASILGPAVAAITTNAAGITEGLKAVGDIIGYFRADYEIKGQTLGSPDDLYIQALVADKLRAKKKEVYLLNFNFIGESLLIKDLGDLLEDKCKMITGAEILKSRFIDGREAQSQALETHLASLRAKSIEYLVKVDEDIIEILRKEIDQATNQLKEAQSLRMPDSQISALETYVSGLRTKLADELVKDTAGARAAVEAEIKKIIQQLEEKDPREKKLSEVQGKALTDQLKLLQIRLVDLLVITSNHTKETLIQEIDRATSLLKECQKNRLPDSQVAAREAHLAGLQAKLDECLVKNDDEAKASLETEIAATIQLIESTQKQMREAKGFVESGKRVSDAIDAFIANISTVPAGGVYSPLVAACIRESLAGERIHYILKLKLLSSGADFIIEKPPFFLRNVNTSYLGGGVVSYIMAEKNGKIVASGTVADVAAIDHKFGKEPTPLKWKIRTE